jgi:hypothetical protein
MRHKGRGGEGSRTTNMKVGIDYEEERERKGSTEKAKQKEVL